MNLIFFLISLIFLLFFLVFSSKLLRNYRDKLNSCAHICIQTFREPNTAKKIFKKKVVKYYMKGEVPYFPNLLSQVKDQQGKKRKKINEKKGVKNNVLNYMIKDISQNPKRMSSNFLSFT